MKVDDLSFRYRTIDPKRFGPMLYNARIENGWTMTRLGQVAGMSSSTVSGYEKGHYSPSRRNFRKLCQVFGWDEKQLLKELEGFDALALKERLLVLDEAITVKREEKQLIQKLLKQMGHASHRKAN